MGAQQVERFTVQVSADVETDDEGPALRAIREYRERGEAYHSSWLGWNGLQDGDAVGLCVLHLRDPDTVSDPDFRRGLALLCIELLQDIGVPVAGVVTMTPGPGPRGN